MGDSISKLEINKNTIVTWVKYLGAKPESLFCKSAIRTGSFKCFYHIFNGDLIGIVENGIDLLKVFKTFGYMTDAVQTLQG
jgi:hypothetical protein